MGSLLQDFNSVRVHLSNLKKPYLSVRSLILARRVKPVPWRFLIASRSVSFAWLAVRAVLHFGFVRFRFHRKASFHVKPH